MCALVQVLVLAPVPDLDAAGPFGDVGHRVARPGWRAGAESQGALLLPFDEGHLRT
jgi:hypothetical protein